MTIILSLRSIESTANNSIQGNRSRRQAYGMSELGKISALPEIKISYGGARRQL